MRPEKPSSDPLEALQQQAGFVRRLARELLHDADLAEDVAQETALAALSTGSTPQRVAAWTSGAARNIATRLRRDRHRSGRREALVARPEALPSTVDQLAREESLRRVTAAVLALPQPYRATVLARFFEDLPPRAIAARDRVPVTTVKSRLRRGLELLRTGLDHEHGGDRRAWALPLAGLAGLDLASPGVVTAGTAWSTAASKSALTATTWIAAMKTKTATTLAAALALLALGAAWLLDGFATDPTQPDQPVHTRTASTGSAPAGNLATASESREPLRTVAAQATDDPTTGIVVATLRWPDGSPAAGALARIYPRGAEHALLVDRVRAADAEGSVRFEAVAPGSVTVYGIRSGSASGNLDAGAMLSLAVTLREGLTVRGRVVDDQARPIPHAEIVLASGDDSAVVTHTDSAGEYSLRGVTDQRDLGARARGYVPAPGVRVDGSEGEPRQVDFVLRPHGAGLALQVIDAASGASLAHARVEVRQDHLPGDDRPPFYSGAADIDGRFEAASLVPGTTEIDVAMPGFAPWSTTVDIPAGVTRTLEVPLQLGSIAAGVVRSSDGEPLTGVLVMHGSWGGLGTRSTSTDADGRYRLTGLPVGPFQLAARSRIYGQTSTTLLGTIGREQTWDAMLDAGRVLRLRLTDEEDAPLGDWMVNALGPEVRDQQRFHGQAITDPDGRLRIPNCPTEPLDLQAMDRSGGILFVHAHRHGVRADGDEEINWVIPRAMHPTASVTGRVVDALGNPGPARVSLAAFDAPDGRPRYHPSHSATDTGRFRLGPLVPGRYEISAEREADGLRSNPVTFTLQPGEELRLEDLELGAPGRLAPRFEILGPQEDSPWITIGTDGPHLVTEHQIRLDLWPEEGLPLAAGRYRLSFYGGNALTSEQVVEIAAGETSTPHVRIETGTRIRYEVHGGTIPEKLSLRATDGQGAELGGATTFPGKWPMRGSFVVRRADAYAIEIESDDGRRDAARYVPGQPLILTLR